MSERNAGLKHLNTGRANLARILEAIASGLAVGSFLWWVGSSLVGIFRPQDLAMPYWSGLPHLRTDTSGFIAFVVAFVCVAVSEYLRLKRRHQQAHEVGHVGHAEDQTPRDRAAIFVLQGGCTAVVIMAAALVMYLSLNTVTHPLTQDMQATHLLSWPTEGSLRMAALLCCVVATALHRFLRVGPQQPVRLGQSVSPSALGPCGRLLAESSGTIRSGLRLHATAGGLERSARQMGTAQFPCERDFLPVPLDGFRAFLD